ncbi:hypothetical protein EPN95_01310 [Patescibacteria group bacterium]|nr:MAG: hypothetical protein EPN95_01310 [Patescibacteria group bacterium]
MPDKEEKQEAVAEKKEKITDYRQPDGKASRRGLIIIISIVGLLLIGVLIGGGAWLYNAAYRQSAFRTRPYTTGMMSRIDADTGYGYGRSIQTQVTDNSVTTTVYTYQTGVVTAVNSDNIVIAGNGKQTTIKTNSSTTYTNDVKPKVNDTVVIAGTTASDGTITATEIRVAN